MSNPSGPDQGGQSAEESADKAADDVTPPAEESPPEDGAPTEAAPIVEEHPTEVMAVEDAGALDPNPPQEEPVERRFTAPSGMDSSTTKMIETPPEPATEIISTPTESFSSETPVAPQMIPGRDDAPNHRAALAAGAGWWR